MSISRRNFLVGCSSAIAAMAGSRIVNLGFAADSAAAAAAGDILVVIFLRGGMDGVNFVAPVNDPDYIAARGNDLRINDAGDDAGLKLRNGPDAKLDFRIHSKAGALKELYDSGQLGIIHACGLTNGTRSHFDAQALMERGIEDLDRWQRTEGWLARYLATARPGGLLPAVAASATVPDSLMGSTLGVAVPSFDDFAFHGDDKEIAALEKLYAGKTSLHNAGREAIKAVRTINQKLTRDENGNLKPYEPENKAVYPDGDLGSALRTVAQLVKMDVGLQVATVDYGGWDTHENQNNYFPGLVEQLSGALAGFHNDLARYHNRLSVVVMSEFGRRVKANQSTGTDHGHGNVMLAIGATVNGGKIHGKWPGLATEQLDDGADLAVTTDYRTVLAELMVRRTGMMKLSTIFPGMAEYKPLGIFKGVDGKVDL